MAWRLLAYGGTAFAERCRTGEWDVPESLLADLYGLVDTRESFGIGTVGGGAPVLIFRQRQHLENRGGYPYTLLFDPGAEVWTRFGWNPAALLLALAHDDIGGALFSAPERVPSEALDVVLTRLTPARQEVDAGRPQSLFANALAGSLMSSTTVGASSRLVGFAHLPDVESLAVDLSAQDDWLPAFCRTGLGWLVGGALAHTGPLGLRLVVDDSLPASSESVEHCVRHGRSILEQWRVVLAAHRPVLAPFHDNPPWSWSIPVSDLLRRVSTTAALLHGRVDDSTYAAVNEVLNAGGLLGKEIAELGWSHAQSLPLKGREHARFVLDQCWLGRHVPVNVVEAMDEAWLHDELIRRGAPPAEPPHGLSLDVPVRSRLWIRALQRATPDQRLAWLPTIHLQLPGLTSFDPIVNAALPNDPSPEHLRLLSRLPDGPLAKAVSRRLRPSLRKQIRKRQVDPLTYVRHLENHHDYYEDISDLPDRRDRAVNFVLGLMDRSTRDPDGEQWLQQLASTRVRALLPLHVKRTVAEHVGTPDAGAGAWSPFLALCALCDGHQVRLPTVEPVEREALLHELEEFSRDRLGSPDCDALEAWIGPIPRQTLDRLRAAVGRRVALLGPSRRTADRGADGRDLELAIQDLFRAPDEHEIRSFIDGALVREDVQSALAATIRQVDSLDGRRFVNALTDAHLFNALLAAAPSENTKVLDWLASEGKLLSIFGATVNAMLGGHPVTDPHESTAAWAVVDFLRSRRDVLEPFARALWGRRAVDFVRELQELSREDHT